MSTNHRLSTLVATLLAAGTLHAQTAGTAPATSPAPNEPVKIDFSTVDKDANGQLSREETVAVTELEKDFDTLDANTDKAITPVEFAKWRLAGKPTPVPEDPTTAPGGSAGAQHMRKTN